MDGDGVKPFFACTLQPFRWIPAIPFNSKYLPMSTMPAQPPIPEAEGHKAAVAAELKAREDGSGEINAYNVDPKHEDALLAGTDLWRAFAFDATAPRVRGCWVTVHTGSGQTVGSSDDAGKYWPQGVQPWSVGAWLEDAELTIGSPLEWKL